MLLDTSQYSRERKLSLGKVLKAGDSTKQAELASRERLATILAATPKQLTDARPDNAIIVQLTEINAELIRYIAKHPDLIRDLPPRKYEELIAEILRDHGHTVNLTPATRDGGRDIMVIMKTQYGEMLMIVECKRFKPERKVGLEIVERFLHVLREKERASIGLIATTSSFSLDAKKSAKEYEYLLKLWDFESVKEMTQHYGTWYTKEKSEIWVPNYAAL